MGNILEPDAIRSSIAAVEFQDADCGSDAVIFHSQTHLISVRLGSDPQVAWTGLRSQAVLQRIFNNGLKDQRGNLLRGDRRVDDDLDLQAAAESFARSTSSDHSIALTLTISSGARASMRASSICR